MSQKEQIFLENYDMSSYERPSVTADMAVFAIMGAKDEAENNYRKDPERKLKLLMIKRAVHPYMDHWALPGGFCKKWESTTETARRELYEETGISEAYLRPFDIFSEPHRDPRGWIISHAFLTLINGEDYVLHASTDAVEAEWFTISVQQKNLYNEIKGEEAHIRNAYMLTLVCEQKAHLTLTAEIMQERNFVNYHENVSYSITSCNGISFDHAKIILCAFLALQKEVNAEGRPIFDLMPEKFTLTQLQRTFEVVQGKKLLAANFRRKMSAYVTETDEISEGAGHRPAKLFRRNLDALINE